MNLIELHLLQSVPVNCINRDQFGSPKSTTFGGSPRARVSSQCWKRAIRKLASEESSLFSGSRSKYFMPQMTEILLLANQDKTAAEKIAREIFEAAKIKFDEKGSSNNLFYFSNGELQAAADAYFAQADAKKAVAAAVKQLEKVTKDGVDIAFFGRMIADSELTLEGAAFFSHAISTNTVSNDIDFFTAVDDLRPEDVTGSSHMGDLEFNTACYYRYIGLNLDLLADDRHLGVMTLEERRQAVRYFLNAAVTAFPEARKNSMAAPTLPGFVFAVARRGQPLSLANAFEKPVRGSGGLLDESAKRLQEHWQGLKTTFGITSDQEFFLPQNTLNELTEGLGGYVK